MNARQAATAEFEVEPEGAGLRVDVFVAGRLDLSRTRVQRLLAEDRVRLDGRLPRKSEVVEPGQRVAVNLPEPEPLAAAAQAIPIDIVYQDRDIVVVDKPAGMVVHPAPGHPDGTLVNALLHHVHDLSGIGGALRPGIVHRLDRETSGLMVVAKNDSAHRTLSEALGRHHVRRRYQAAVWGHLSESHLEIDAPIGRDPKERRRMAVVKEGRRAVTRARVRERWRSAELLDVALETGRTHQIRVHFAHVGHPIVGDVVYGASRERGMDGPDRRWALKLARRVPRQFLHATELMIDHPRTGRRHHFSSPLPQGLADAACWARGDDL